MVTHVRTKKLLALPLLAVAGVAVALFAVTPAASAHSQLVSTSPDGDEPVTSQPDRVTLTFNEPIQGKFSAVAVTDPGGHKVNVGKPTASGKKLEQRVKTFTDAGKYKVGWRTVSADGHPVSGTFTFTVADSAVAEASPTATAASTPASMKASEKDKLNARAERSDDRSFVERHAAHLIIAAVVVVLGVTVVVWERRRRHD